MVSEILEEVETYVLRIATHMVLELCLEANRRPVVRVER